MDLGACSIPKLPRAMQRMRHLSRPWKHPATRIGGTGRGSLERLRHLPAALPSPCSTFPPATPLSPPDSVSPRLSPSLPIHPSPSPHPIPPAVPALVAHRFVP